MEAKVGGMSGENMWRGNRSKEWDSTTWKWDGDLFIASPLNPVVNRFVLDGTHVSPAGISSNSTSSCSDEGVIAVEMNQRGLQSTHTVAVEENLSLTLGGQSDPNAAKRSKASGGSRVACQVEGCGVDLTSAKDYHRRHKVCETHAKASRALVGNTLQRFCQQCSRFHILEEFDEGKRSCRRRLAGHNKRRRKAQPEPAAASSLQNNDQNNNLLISLLRLISSLHSSNSNQPPDQELLSHLLKDVTSQGGEQGAPRVSESAQEVANPGGDAGSGSLSKNKRSHSFDLNDTYIDSDECTDEDRRVSNESSPQRTSGNSEYASQSPSNSGDQSRTDRIVFKLFGKDPNDLPLVLRTQILDWLSHSPTNIEGYIRPGCVILTVYLRQPEYAWEDLHCDLSYSLSKLLSLFDDPSWTRGWMYVLVRHQFALAYNGEVIFEKSLSVRGLNYRKIFSVKPIATPPGNNVNFEIKGANLIGQSARLLCAMNGGYLLEAKDHETISREKENQIMNYYISVPFVNGRGFFEIEDEGLSFGFFPFIVAESEVCREIRALEGIIDGEETDGRTHALEFLNEFGWLLHPSASTTPFSLTRLVRLVEFSLDREWCAVLKRLLDVLLDSKLEIPNLPLALSELGLLHKAVRRNSERLVKFLLNYTPQTKGSPLMPLFRPDARDASGLTPLHVAAGKEGAARVVDALTSDPQRVGREAWGSVRDPAGLTPEYYARLRGHVAYVDLVRRKVAAKVEYVALDVEKGGARECRGCRRRAGLRSVHGSIVYRPAMVAMIAIAAVCVCAALYFKSCPEVVFVFRPFRWELLQYGPI